MDIEFTVLLLLILNTSPCCASTF